MRSLLALSVLALPAVMLLAGDTLLPGGASHARTASTPPPSSTGSDDGPVDRARLGAAIEGLSTTPGVEALLIVHGGELIEERYWGEGGADVPHNIKSASKSVMSALIGIAVEQGLLDPQQRITELLPEAAEISIGDKRNITVEHLLSMSSGYEPTSYQAYSSWVGSNDWIRDLLRKPLLAPPGSTYHYSTGNTHLLSAILSETSHLTTRAFAERNLFGPMGIEVQGWTASPRGIHMGGNNLSLMPLDIAKFGQLYLNGGLWGSRQIVPRHWVERSLRPAVDTVHPAYGRYGLLWWLPGDGLFAAVGYGGQYVLVSPRHDAVIVLLCTQESKGDAWEQRTFGLLRNEVLESLAPALLAPGRLADLVSHAPIASARTTNRVNLRAAPSLRGLRIAVVSERSRVSVLDREGPWLYAKVAGQLGWLHSDYARQIEAGPGAPPRPASDVQMVATPPLETDTTARPEATTELQRLTRALGAALGVSPDDIGLAATHRTTARVNFRSAPSEKSRRLQALDSGTPLLVLDRRGSWLQARVGDTQGWVHSDYAAELPGSKQQTGARRQPGSQPLARSLSASIQAARAVVAERDQAREALEASRQHLAMVQATLSESLTQSREQSSTAGTELARVRAESETALGTLIHELEAERTDVSTSLARLQSEKESLNEALRESQARWQSASQELEELEDLRAEISTRDQRLAVLSEELEAALARSRADAESIASLRAQSTRLVERMAQLQDVDERDSALGAAEARIAELENALEYTRSAELASSDALATAHAQLAKQKSELTARIRSRGELERALSRAYSHHADIGKTLEQAQAELRALHAQRQADQAEAAADLDASARRIAELESQNKAAIALQGALDNARNENADLSAKLDNTRKSAEQRSRELESLRASAEAAATARRVADDRVRSLEAELVTAGERNRVTAETLAALRADYTSRNEAMQDSQASTRQALQVAEQRVAALEAELEGVRVASRQLSESNAGLLDDGARARVRIEELQTLLARSEESNSRAATQLEALQARAQSGDRSLQETRDALSEREQALASADTRIAGLEGELARARDVTDRATQALENAGTRNAELQLEVERGSLAEARVKELEAEFEETRVNAQVLQRELLAERERNQQLESRNASLAEVAVREKQMHELLAAVEHALAQAPSSEPGAATRPDENRRIRTSAHVNFRAAPGLNAPRIKLLPPNTELQALARSDDWIQARIGNLSGWLHGRYASEIVEPAPAVTVAPATLPERVAQLAGSAGALHQTVAELRDRVSAADSRTAALEAEVRDGAAQRDEQQAALGSVREEAAALRQRLASSDLRAESLENQLTGLKAERGERQAELASVVDELDESKAQLISARRALDDARASDKQRAEQLAASQAARDNAQKAVTELEQRARQAAESDRLAQERLALLEPQLAEKLERTEQLTAELQSLRSERLALSGSLERTSQISVQQETALMTAEAQIAELKAALAEERRGSEAAASTVAQLRAGSQDLEAKMAALQTRTADVAEALASVRATQKVRASELATARAAVEEQGRELERLRRSGARQRELLASGVAQRQGLEARLRRAQALRQRLEQALAELSQRLDTVAVLSDAQSGIESAPRHGAPAVLGLAAGQTAAPGDGTDVEKAGTGPAPPTPSVTRDGASTDEPLASLAPARRGSRPSVTQGATRAPATHSPARAPTPPAGQTSPSAAPATTPAPSAAASVTPKPPDGDPQPSLEEQVGAAVEVWAAAWARQDVGAYLARYAAGFRPPGGLTRGAWERQRRARIEKPKFVEVDISELQVTSRSEARVAATFTQRYRANHYKDTVRKTLEMVREKGQWRIVSERSKAR